MKLSQSSSYMPLKAGVKRLVVSLFGNTRYQKVIIVGQQRTGSTLLASYLNSHPAVEIRGEPFRLLENRTSIDTWNRVFSRYLPWRKYVGFRLFYYHPEDSDDREVWSLIENNPDIKIIHIQRRNILRSYVSKQIAKKTGVWNTILGKVDSEFDKRVEIDFEDFLRTFTLTKTYESDFDSSYFQNHAYIEVTYEDLVMDPQLEMKKMFDFLGLKAKEVKTTLKKQNPEELKDLIKNYSEFANKLRTSSDHPELKLQLDM